MATEKHICTGHKHIFNNQLFILHIHRVTNENDNKDSQHESVLTKLQKEAEVHISKQQRRSLGYWEPSIFLIGHVN